MSNRGRPPTDIGTAIRDNLRSAKVMLAAIDARAVAARISDLEVPLQSPATNPGSRPTGIPDPTHSAAVNRKVSVEALDTWHDSIRILDAADSIRSRMATLEDPDAKSGPCWTCTRSRRGQVLDSTGQCLDCVKQLARALRRTPELDVENWRRTARRNADQDRASVCARFVSACAATEINHRQW